MDSQIGPGVGDATKTDPQRRSKMEAVARFTRLFSLGATVLYPLVGVATGATGPDGAAVAWAVVVGIVFHGYADIGNDVLDLPIDRTDPRRGTSPLVRGEVPPQCALALALAMIPMLLAMTSFSMGSPAMPALVAALVLIGLYNIAGKAIPVPVVADVVQGTGWAALVLAGAAVSGGATPATAWAGGAVVVYIAMVNGLHGAIRDAVNDRLAGARTTALLLGADVVDGGTIVLPRILVAWGGLLHVGFGAALVGVVATSGLADLGIGVAAVATGSATAALYGASTVALVGAYRARRTLRDAMAYGTWHLFLLPASLLAASSPMMPQWMAIVSVAAFVLPPVLFGRAVRGHDFDIPSTTLPTQVFAVAPAAPRLAGLWEMTRPGTPLAAAALVAAGAWVSGDVPIWVVPLMAATALAVAAANVFNDRCDVPADAINRPDRPLIAGPTTGNDADKFVLGATVAAVALAATLDNHAALATALLLSFGLAYSLFMRRVAFVGQAAVAGLFGAPLLYGGALAAGGLTYRTWIAFGIAVVYVFGREVMKGIPDRPGDVAAGYRSPATVFGEEGALRLYRVVAVAFCIASLGVTMIVEDPLYLAASMAFAVGPTIRTMLMVRGRPSTSDVERAIAFSGLVFASGLIPLLALGGAE